MFVCREIYDHPGFYRDTFGGIIAPLRHIVGEGIVLSQTLNVSGSVVIWEWSLQRIFSRGQFLAFGYCRCLRLSVCPSVRPCVR